VSETVVTAVQDHVFTIRINRPEVRNCIDGRTAALLSEAWLRFRDDPELWVAIITGTGDKAFCAGADLGALDTLGPGPDSTEAQRQAFIDQGEGFLGQTRMVDCFKPIIAAINGDALAGGLELACLADIRLVEAHARMGVTCRRFGVPLCDGGTQRLPRILGFGRAMDLIITGRFIGAEEAHFMGLASEVLPTGTSYAEAVALARRLCMLPQAAMRSDKEAAVRGLDLELEDGLRVEAALAWRAIEDPDMAEGARAFKAKEEPRYRDLGE